MRDDLMGLDRVDQARFRHVLGQFATGVTVVTAADGDGPMGLSMSSFTSVSLEPPLVAVCVSSQSSTWPRMREVGGFCVNVLSADQEAVSRAFAAPGPGRFTAVGWTPAPSGAPVIDGALAFLDCRLEAEHPGGDHVIAVGRVLDLEVRREGAPLVFFRGGYGRFSP